MNQKSNGNLYELLLDGFHKCLQPTEKKKLNCPIELLAFEQKHNSNNASIIIRVHLSHSTVTTTQSNNWPSEMHRHRNHTQYEYIYISFTRHWPFYYSPFHCDDASSSIEILFRLAVCCVAPEIRSRSIVIIASDNCLFSPENVGQ